MTPLNIMYINNNENNNAPKKPMQETHTLFTLNISLLNALNQQN